jgi:hypothetical protein
MVEIPSQPPDGVSGIIVDFDVYIACRDLASFFCQRRNTTGYQSIKQKVDDKYNPYDFNRRKHD